jgi:uncharacterized membrane protein YoaK (UPF0700 family)
VTWERRYALLLGLTGTAGALDALSFVFLGKVFTSFQSGNVLFLGLGIGDANWGLVVRAAAVLTGFFVGTVVGARRIGTRLLPPAMHDELGMVAIEAALLVAFAVLWLAVGMPDKDAVSRVVLLALGATAMGIQAALALSLKIPNVMTVALTATLAYLGQRVGAGVDAAARDADIPSAGLLGALLVTYVACALLVAALPGVPALALIPLALLVTGVTLDTADRRA